MTNEEFEKIKEIANRIGRKLDGSDPYVLSSIATFGVTPWSAGAIQIKALKTNLPEDERLIKLKTFYTSKDQINIALEERKIARELAFIAQAIIGNLSIAVAIEPWDTTFNNMSQTQSVGQLINNRY